VDRIGWTQDKDEWRALVSAVETLRIPLNAGKFLSSCATGGFSRRALLQGVSQYQYSGDIRPADVT
jgi:hypothetical protein